MGLFKTVFEVNNMQLFLKDKESSLGSPFFLVIRDHLGTTPLANLRNILVQDLTEIRSSISKTKTGNCSSISLIIMPSLAITPVEVDVHFVYKQ
ncbi:sey1 [Colletotrichum melonis]|uniref:Sey1 n=1 Tax=Colletotrichum melonis TaxID=1209925 RepID=A0AAI9XQH2_9PEZI|nr:sey1 [Colletotrichum melonis]